MSFATPSTDTVNQYVADRVSTGITDAEVKDDQSIEVAQSVVVDDQVLFTITIPKCSIKEIVEVTNKL